MNHKYVFVLLISLFSIIIISGCIEQQQSITNVKNDTENNTDNISDSVNTTKPWLYVLTGYENNIQQIINTPSQFLVIDAFKNTPNELFRKGEVVEFKKNHGIVLAYMSIGEAEDYRYYWKADWQNNPPAWMGRTNPDWGSRKVKYWEPEWQNIIFEYIDRIAAQGFDGVYLDIIDGYEYWSDPDNGEDVAISRDNAAQRMITFISAIRDRARRTNQNFRIFPQNSPELVRYGGYLSAIDGIGKEDTWYNGYDDRNNQGSSAILNDAEAIQEQVSYLRAIKQAGKIVVVVDYFSIDQKDEARDFMNKASCEGFYAYASDTRKLDDISILGK